MTIISEPGLKKCILNSQLCWDRSKYKANIGKWAVQVNNWIIWIPANSTQSSTLTGRLRGLNSRMVTWLLLHTWRLGDFSVRPYRYWRNTRGPMKNCGPHWPGWWCSWPSCSFHSVNGISVKPAALLGPSCPDSYWWKPRSPPADSCGSGSAAWASALWKSWKRWIRH